MKSSKIDIQARLLEAVGQVQRSFQRLILLVGPSGTGKTGILRRLAGSQKCLYKNL